MIKTIEEKRMIEEIEIIDQIIYDQTIEEINNKLKPIGLKVEYIEEKNYMELEEIKIDLVNIDLWYNYYFKYNGLKCYIPYIKDQDDFKEYGYTVIEYVKEILEEVFNEPSYYYNDVIKHDLCSLSGDLLEDIFNTIEKHYFKSKVI
jgi:hypothetical protein